VATVFVPSIKIDFDVLLSSSLISGLGAGDTYVSADTRTPAGQAALAAALADPTVFCVEVGGSGQTDLNNFDHHQVGGPTESACLQIWRKLGSSEDTRRLVEYCNTVDTGGLQALGDKPKVALTDILAGIILVAGDQKWTTAKLVDEASLLFSMVANAGWYPAGDFSSYMEVS
jgi:hypothetical protein